MKDGLEQIVFVLKAEDAQIRDVIMPGLETQYGSKVHIYVPGDYDPKNNSNVFSEEQRSVLESADFIFYQARVQIPDVPGEEPKVSDPVYQQMARKTSFTTPIIVMGEDKMRDVRFYFNKVDTHRAADFVLAEELKTLVDYMHTIHENRP